MKVSRYLQMLLLIPLFLSLPLRQTTASELLGPIATKALINSSTTLHCRIKLKDDFDIIKVQWLKDGFGYENETLRDYFGGRYRMPGPRELGIFDLVIESLESQDDGEYACQVNAAVHNLHNSNILKTSKSINLTIVVPPKVVFLKSISLESPLNHTMESVDGQVKVIWGKAKGYIELSCLIPKSRPSAKLEWSLGKHAIKEENTGDLEGNEQGSVFTKSEALMEADQFYFKTESRLKLRLRRDHNGEFLKCNVINKADFLNQTPKSSHVLVNVLYVTDVKLEVSPRRPYYQFSEHEVVKINCSASTNPISVTFSWIKYDPQTNRLHVIKAFDHYGLLKLKISRDLNKMFIRCQVLASAENHLCHPNMEVGTEFLETTFSTNCSASRFITSSNQIPVRVRYSPIIFDSVLETKSAFLGDVVTIECNADSNPPSQISWYKSILTLKEIMSNPDIRSHDFFKDFSLKPDSLLSLISVSSRHQFTVTDADKMGLFICIARASGFLPAQKAVFVGQGAIPQILNNHKFIVAKPGSSVRIPCHIFSIPLPKKEDILWLKSPNFNQLEPKLKDQVYQEDRLAGLVSYLYIHQVSDDDYGIYNCSVVNPYGYASDIIALIPPAETPIIFIIGSSCAAILAILFAFVIFIIIRNSKVRSSTNNIGSSYSKGHDLSPCKFPLTLDNLDTEFTNSYTDAKADFCNENFYQVSKNSVFDHPSMNFAESLMNNVKNPLIYSKDDRFDLTALPGMDHQTNLKIIQRRPDWMDCHNAQIEAANESTRSYDSGVCPDESNLTSSCSHQPIQSTNVSVTPYQMLPFYQQPKTILDISHSPNMSCHTPRTRDAAPLFCTMALRQYLENSSSLSNNNCSPLKIVNESETCCNISPDVTSRVDSILPYIIAYSPSNLSIKKLDWSPSNQTTKL